MIKKLIMKALGIESRAEVLARLEVSQAAAKETIERAESALARLLDLYDNAIFEGEVHKMQVAKHIDLVKTRLAFYHSEYAERQIAINIIRATVEAENVDLSLKGS